MNDSKDLNCPVAAIETEVIQLAHGGGGRLMHSLLETVILSAFENPAPNECHDGAIFEVGGERLAFTTDSYVVKPLFFPGGDIGSLAVNGTVNDLAMCGAQPLYLSAAFIIEEGFPMAELRQVVASMETAARQSGVYLVTGDTKVVDRGNGDGLFVNTAGIGAVRARTPVNPGAVEAGDVIILSGDLGRHGIAIMAAREHLAFETSVASDCAPLWEPVKALIEAGIELHCLRDLTRGGLASALIEIAETAACALTIEETAIPVLPEVQAACDLLGLDALYVANEGRFAAFVPAAQAAQTVELLGAAGLGAVAIGQVTSGAGGTVAIAGPYGATRRLTMFSGEQLPRIC
ncbi:hydrogenase expression/formation protein HypE [Luminiphilus syltensis NOR5-1B]|uniref:Hydrogenase expression/formation protein HypE n=1 Tax=Luminiphilus syltensis NOR5-1B TaxID=565045 RepID=B8KXU9_9GAMM|nr:hydrogenase expression/formation protein HypE [Luminiphilus syltensis]EED34946.1 hydrogenase expression/formation protein HypE [Luminiphilus syltensis NOR5-1B]